MTQNKRKPKTKEIDLIKEQLQMYEQLPEQMKVIKGWTDEELNEELDRLRTLIENSNRGKSSRRKGASYENTIAKKFKEAYNISLVRTPMSGGFQKSSDSEDFKGDINCIEPNKTFKLHLECKNQQQWSVGKWWKQAEEDCPDSRIPALVMHRFQKNVDGKRVETAEDFVMLRLDDFLHIVDKEKIIQLKEVYGNEQITNNLERQQPVTRIEPNGEALTPRRIVPNSSQTKRVIKRKSSGTREE